MRAALAILLFSVGCGGSSPPPSAPPKPSAPPAAEPEAPLEPISSSPPGDNVTGDPPAPLAEAPPPPAKPPVPVHERLRDPEGPVPGLPGFSLVHKKSANHCGGVQVIVKRTKKVAAADAPLAKLYAIEFPKNLNFDPEDRRANERAMKEFNGWLDSTKAAATEGRMFYEKSIAEHHDMASVARVAQISARFSSMIARAEIPLDVRKGELAAEKIKAYCGAVEGAAEPLVEQTEETIRFCAEKLAQQPSDGWWTAYCVPR